MRNSTKKVIAPIVITVLIAIYFIFFLSVLFFSITSTIGKVIGIIIPLIFICISIYMLVERIKEIRSGEEDDLSKY